MKGMQRYTLEGTDTHISGTVRAMKTCVIDRGVRGTVYEERIRYLATVLVSEKQSNSKLCQETRKASKGKRREGETSRVKEK